MLPAWLYACISKQDRYTTCIVAPCIAYSGGSYNHFLFVLFVLKYFLENWLNIWQLNPMFWKWTKTQNSLITKCILVWIRLQIILLTTLRKILKHIRHQVNEILLYQFLDRMCISCTFSYDNLVIVLLFFLQMCYSMDR